MKFLEHLTKTEPLAPNYIHRRQQYSIQTKCIPSTTTPAKPFGSLFLRALDRQFAATESSLDATIANVTAEIMPMNNWWIRAMSEEFVGRFSFRLIVISSRATRMVAAKEKRSSGELCERVVVGKWVGKILPKVENGNYRDRCDYDRRNDPNDKVCSTVPGQMYNQFSIFCELQRLEE